MGYEESLKYKHPQTHTKPIHWGQLKLMLAEIFYLSRYYHKPYTVLYIGAAPGLHIPFLVDMFPNFKFILYDPEKFGIKETDRIEIHQKYFTNEDAKKYSGKRYLFMSDIRNIHMDEARTSLEKMNEYVNNDNKMQLEWVQTIRPKSAYLKFRLPFGIKEHIKYFNGKIFMQPWTKVSAETRLLVRNYDNLKSYDPIEFEEKLVYFQTCIRRNKYDALSDVIKDIGLINYYDSNFMLLILKYYLKKSGLWNDDKVELKKLTMKLLNFMKPFGKNKYKMIVHKK
jgi:hypothetical protein